MMTTLSTILPASLCCQMMVVSWLVWIIYDLLKTLARKQASVEQTVETGTMKQTVMLKM